MADAPDFPDDLVKAQRELDEVKQAQAALLAQLPRWVVEHSDADGTIHPGWSAEEQAESDALWTRRHELTALVLDHPYWSDVPAEKRMAARMGLKHLDA